MAVTTLDEYPLVSKENICHETVYPLFDQASELGENAVNTEDENMLTAKRLKSCRLKLIEALAQSALTPLWLVKEYEQQLDKKGDDSDEESKLSSGMASPLLLIRQYCRGAADKTPAKGGGAHAVRKALQWFPFSFKDLTQLVDLHCYALGREGGDDIHFRERSARMSPDSVARHRARFDEILDANQQPLGQHPWLLSAGVDNDDNKERYIAVLLAAEQGWLRVRQQLVNANSGLVLFIANQYRSGFLDFDDLVQEGQAGLLKAADRYDYRLGFKFSTYAGYWIRQAISRALSRCERVVRIPCGQVGVINKFFRDREQLLVRTGKEPSLQDLSEYTGLSPAEIDSIFAISQSAVPIEISTEDDDSIFAPIDYLEQQVFKHPFGLLAQSDLEQLIEQALKILSPREAKIVCDHFGVDAERELTLKEIGLELNLTRERVRQIEVGALNKIRRHYGRQLSSFL